LLPAVQDEIILSTMDSAPPAADAQALDLPQTGADTLPQAAPVPPPFGTSYEFDAAGLIKPTAAGIVTPEGYRLVAGAPPVVPPARPAAIAALAPVPLPGAPLPGAPLPDATTQPAAEIPTPDPALEAARPQARPADLVPQPDEGAIAPAIVENPLAGYRPRARPAAIIAAAEQRRLDDEARRVAEAASIAAAAAAEELAAAEAAAAEAAAKAAAEPVSPLAVAISRKPPQRPRGFDRAVEAAVAAAAAATLAPPPVAVAAAAPAPPPKEEPQRSARTAVPGEDEEPDVAAAAKAPRIPSSASVAKNATYVNAIDLRKTNLIGVYGTPAKRYALIRTSNGQYRKVNVGDRVDGGTVAAITDSELRYKKGSRMLTLALPQG
ncbi:MAG: translation initiation factor 2, partial [Gemmobacter sp.]